MVGDPGPRDPRRALKGVGPLEGRWRAARRLAGGPTGRAGPASSALALVLVLAVGGCAGAVHAHTARATSSSLRIEVRMSVAPNEGVVRGHARFRGTVEPPVLAWSIDPRLSVRCAPDLTASECTLRALGESADGLWQITGSDVALEIDGFVGTAWPEPPHVGDDYVELTTWGNVLVPQPVDRRGDVDVRLEVEVEDGWRLAATRELPAELRGDDPLALVATEALSESRVACDGAEVGVAYDADFPGRQRALELARLICQSARTMTGWWGDAEGAGAFRVLVSPRRGTAYYVAPRGLVVPAYYGGYADTAGTADAEDAAAADSFTLEPAATRAESDVELTTSLAHRLTRLAAIHETAHAWFHVPIEGWRRLHEALAEYAALRALRVVGEEDDADEVERLAGERLASAGDADYALRPYDLGVRVLDALARERGEARVDAFLRRMALERPTRAEELEPLVLATLGEGALDALGPLRSPAPAAP